MTLAEFFKWAADNHSTIHVCQQDNGDVVVMVDYESELISIKAFMLATKEQLVNDPNMLEEEFPKLIEEMKRKEVRINLVARLLKMSGRSKEEIESIIFGQRENKPNTNPHDHSSNIDNPIFFGRKGEA